MAAETESFLICFCQMAKMVSFQIFPSNQPILFPNVILCSAGPTHLNKCISFSGVLCRWLLISANLLSRWVMSSSSAASCLLSRLLVLKWAVDVIEGSREKSICFFAKSSLVCLSSRSGSNPVGLLPTSKKKVKSIIVCVSSNTAVQSLLRHWEFWKRAFTAQKYGAKVTVK